MDPIPIPITDELDLHTFRPGEVSDLLQDYFRACIEKGIPAVRVVHGKGTGALRRGVHAFLDRSPLVRAFADAPPEAGGWGATLVELNPSTRTQKKKGPS
jgi:DNA-nicking Smr family endonuclease